MQESGKEVRAEMLHRLEGLVSRCGGQGAAATPDFRMDLDVRELATNFLQVIGKPFIPAAVVPACRHLVAGVRKHGTEAVVDINLCPILPFNFIDARLGDIGSYAEDIGEAGEGDLGGSWRHQ